MNKDEPAKGSDLPNWNNQSGTFRNWGVYRKLNQLNDSMILEAVQSVQLELVDLVRNTSETSGVIFGVVK